MSWMDVLKYLVLMFGAMCVICIAISMHSDGKAKTAFINVAGRYPAKRDIPE